jgi:hypothetical protein
MAGLATGHEATGVERARHRRFAHLACADYAPWLRVSIAALAVLALLILLSAPAARGVTPVSGDQLWVDSLDGPDHALDGIVDVVEAPNGSLYAAGGTNDDWASGAELLLLKQRPSAGAGSWTLQWDGPAGGVWVAGAVKETGGGEDWLLARHQPNGARRWLRTYHTPVDHLDDRVNAITLCGTRSLFVGGVIGTATHTDDAGTAKYLR